MFSQHENAIETRLEEVSDLGVGLIRRGELRRWYNQDRLSKTVWRDIAKRWDDVHGDQSLLIGENPEGSFALVNGAGLMKDPKAANSWLEPISDWT